MPVMPVLDHLRNEQINRAAYPLRAEVFRNAVNGNTEPTEEAISKALQIDAIVVELGAGEETFLIAINKLWVKVMERKLGKERAADIMADIMLVEA